MIEESMKQFGSSVGLRGGFVFLRGTWNQSEYVMEQSRDGETWEPWDQTASTFSVRYHGGPKDGVVEM